MRFVTGFGEPGPPPNPSLQTTRYMSAITLKGVCSRQNSTLEFSLNVLCRRKHMKTYRLFSNNSLTAVSPGSNVRIFWPSLALNTGMKEPIRSGSKELDW